MILRTQGADQPACLPSCLGEEDMYLPAGRCSATDSLRLINQSVKNLSTPGLSVFKIHRTMNRLTNRKLAPVILLVLLAIAIWSNIDYFAVKQHVSQAFQNYSTNRGFTAFGDSISEGVGASDASNAWPALLAREMNWALTNRAVGGFQCPDAASSVYRQHVALESVFTFMIGTGESVHLTDHPRGVQEWHLPEVAWLAIPDRAKHTGTDPRVFYQGNWSEPVSFAIGKASSQTGATATISNLTGTTILISYARKSIDAGNPGAFGLTVDGKPWGGACQTSLAFKFSSHPSVLNKAAPCVEAITNLTAGRHTLVLTVTSKQGSIELDWVAALSGTPEPGWPKVFLGNLPAQRHSRFRSADNNEETLKLFNRMIAENCYKLNAWGLNVRLVDVAATLNRETELADWLHPNDAGHRKLKDAFRSSMVAF